MGGKGALKRKITLRASFGYFKIKKLVCQKLKSFKEKRRIG